MDIADIRRERTRQLARQLAGGRGSGHTQMAERMGWGSSRTSQLIGKNAKKKIGDATARAIESEFGKPRGWLDRMEDRPQTDAVEDEALLLECLTAVRDEIARLDLNLTQEDADELLARATVILYKFSQQAGRLMPPDIAIASVRL